MQKNNRKDLIIEYLNRNGFASVEELGKSFYASESSIRRDLAELELSGLVKRSWGGAKALTSPNNITTFSNRSYTAAKEKTAIAKKAAELIKSGDIIFLDQSSTSYFLAIELMKSSALTVVTNNLEILCLLSKSDHNLISTGGTVSKRNANCLLGPASVKTYESIYSDFAFFSVHSLDDNGIATDCTQEETFVRNAMLANAKKKILLCDSTKIGSRSSFKQCSLCDIDMLICDVDVSERFKTVAPDLIVV